MGGVFCNRAIFDQSIPCDHVPDDTAVLRFSGAVKTIDTMNTDFVTLRPFEFTGNAGAYRFSVPKTT